MITEARNSFLHDVKKIVSPTVKMNVEAAILSVKQANNIKDIPELKKLKGYKKDIFYRIAVGDYRIGVTIENDTVTFVTLRHRKDIYKFFPR